MNKLSASVLIVQSDLILRRIEAATLTSLGLGEWGKPAGARDSSALPPVQGSVSFSVQRLRVPNQPTIGSAFEVRTGIGVALQLIRRRTLMRTCILLFHGNIK